ncbi:MAG TPA: hypothetical protein VLB27_03165, partial [candidate division Zixibacteria bacterium]|nr:hypothetical protein [candidate division Zixibacteria bacterium]
MPRGQATISLIDLFSAESPAATEFRRLLHNINGAYAAQVARQRGETNPDLQGIVKQLRRVMITSALGSEGKSTVASFLAISSARFKERRTLLVDADLRRPSIHQLFALERAGGLVEILSEGLAPRQAV